MNGKLTVQDIIKTIDTIDKECLKEDFKEGDGRYLDQYKEFHDKVMAIIKLAERVDSTPRGGFVCG